MSLMTIIVKRSEILKYYFCHFEYLEEQINLKKYNTQLFKKQQKAHAQRSGFKPQTVLG